MWLKSLNSETWINTNHITHFTIENAYIPHDYKTHSVYAYLDAGESGIYAPRQSPPQVQIRIPVCQGTGEECQVFIKEQTFLESAYQWLGYLVAGVLGAIITVIFT